MLSSHYYETNLIVIRVILGLPFFHNVSYLRAPTVWIMLLFR